MELYKDAIVQWRLEQPEVLALHHFTNRTGKLPNQAGIALDHAEACAFATDQCRLVVAEVRCDTAQVPDGIRPRVVFPLSILERVLPLLSQRSDVLELTFGTGDIVKVRIINKTAPFEPHPFEIGIPGIEPVEWKPIMEHEYKGAAPQSFVVDATFLTDLRFIADAAGTPHVRLIHRGDGLKPIQVEFDNDLTTWKALLAPVKPIDEESEP